MARTRAFIAALMLAAGWASIAWADAGSVSATMSVGVRVVRSCSVNADAALSLSVDCRAGSTSVLRFGIDMPDGAPRGRVTFAAGRMGPPVGRTEQILWDKALASLSIPQAAAAEASARPVVVTIDF